MPKRRLKAARVPRAVGVRGPLLRIGDLAHAVLALYGATPLSPKSNQQRHLGRMVMDGQTVLVLADTQNRPTSTMTLQRMLALRDDPDARWDRLVVLGRRFDPAIGAAIAALDDDRLDVLVIPSDLRDQIGRCGGHAPLAGKVNFNCRQYLMLKQVTRTQFAASAPELLIVTLDNYILLAPHAIKLDEVNRGRLNAVLNKRPLSLIEYWAVDPDYDGSTFNPVWHDYLGNATKNRRAQRVLTQAVLSLPPHAGARRIRVRAVDMFGQEAEVEVTVDAPSATQHDDW